MPATALPEDGMTRAYQLRNCAKWHERQAHRAPKRAKHHHSTAARLRQYANEIIRATSGSINSTAPKGI
jgi:hypothetical protein